MVDAAAPQDTSKNTELAIKNLEGIVGKAGVTTPAISINRGLSVQTWKPGASEEIVELSIKSDAFKQSGKQSDEIAQNVMRELHKLYSVRDNAIVLSPKEYLEHCRNEVKALQAEAKAVGIDMGDVDFSLAPSLRDDVSNNQKSKYASQVLAGPNVTSIRIQIPTNPTKLEEAETLAKKVAADIEGRLPEIKKAMIERIKRKSYAKLTPEQEKSLQEHELKVTVQEQGNWTGVHLEIRSPEQVKLRDHPEDKTNAKPEDIEKTNMLMMIEDADKRAKIAARAVLFQGEKLEKPTSYYSDVAGTEDIKNALGKMLHYTKQKKNDPAFARRADALMKETFLVSNEEWNLPPEQQSLYKRRAHARIKPEHPDELKITMNMPVGKADEMLAGLATDLGPLAAPATAQATETPAPAEAPVPVAETPATVETPAIPEIAAAATLAATASEKGEALGAAAGIATPEINAAAAGAGVVCPHDQLAVAAAGAACIAKDDMPVGQLGQTVVTRRNIKNFLANLGMAPQPSGMVDHVASCSAAANPPALAM